MIEAYNYLELSKACKKMASSIGNIKQAKELRIYVLADSASQHFTMAIKGYAYLEGIETEVKEADYDQIDLQISDLNSDLYNYNPDYLVIYMCVQKAQDLFYKVSPAKRGEFAKDRFAKIQGYFDCIKDNLPNCKVIFPLYIEHDDMIYGNRGLSNVASFIFQVKELNHYIMQYASEVGNTYLINTDRIAAGGADVCFDDAKYCNYKLALSMDATAELARQIVSVVDASQGNVIKCVILDLDNTLWGGVIGDDGIENIEIGELGIGHAFSRFQMWLKALKQRGILLCICSKNDKETALKPFCEHPDMILREEDITMFVANWENKATNIKHIRETLNIGMDSIVFLDDSPFERALVRENIPEINVPDIPDDPSLYVSYLESLNLFETVSISENDDMRTLQYKQEADRAEFKQQSNTVSDFLVGLSMVGKGEQFEPFYYSRIAQLTQRSNQFNLRTIRYTEQEISVIAKNPNYLPFYFTLKDAFGDYGVVSVVIIELQSDTDAFIDTWLMSCRVLKRDMEHYVLNLIVDKLKERGIVTVIGEYRETVKNKMVKHFYEEMGFTPIPGKANQYELQIEEYIPHKHFINKEDTGNEQE